MNRLKILALAALALPHVACLGDDTNNPVTQGLRPNKPQQPDHGIVIAGNTEGAAQHVDVTLLDPVIGPWSETLDPSASSSGPQLTLIHEISPAGSESLLVLDDHGNELCRPVGLVAVSYEIVAASCGLRR
jgi:hypothetical protein